MISLQITERSRRAHGGVTEGSLRAHDRKGIGREEEEETGSKTLMAGPISEPHSARGFEDVANPIPNRHSADARDRDALGFEAIQ